MTMSDDNVVMTRTDVKGLVSDDSDNDNDWW